MSIKVKFFASLREQIASPVTDVPMTDEHGNAVKTIADVWKLSTPEPMPTHVLCSVNLEHCEPSDLVNDGDEVAFFPPVTGG